MNLHANRFRSPLRAAVAVVLLPAALALAACGSAKKDGSDALPVPPDRTGQAWSESEGRWVPAGPDGQPLSSPAPNPALATAGADGALVATGPGTPEPPGGAPPGKVWSPEHGHYHDALPPGAPGTSTAPLAPGATPTPAPPGEPPPGKVWSPEHGHYHDAPGAAGASPFPGATPIPGAPFPGATPIPAPVGGVTPGGPGTPEPPGDAPPGKVWSPEHGHYHDAPGAVPTGGDPGLTQLQQQLGAGATIRRVGPPGSPDNPLPGGTDSTQGLIPVPAPAPQPTPQPTPPSK